MNTQGGSLEGIGGGRFLEEDGLAETRTFSSGRGRVAGERKATSGAEVEYVCGPGGRLGWRARVPGGRPLATPAVSDGRLFVGGGFGSHEFYSFDAGSGKLLWSLHTDDGPTAATVADGCVTFNTESCTIYVVDAHTGRVIWERWLGDPLMAQPAICRSRVLMAYPDRERRHQLAAFDLKTGEPLWQTELIADVITAPVVAEGAAYASTLDGTVYRIDLETGARSWSIPHKATSAPWVHAGRIFVSLREADEPAPGSGGITGTVEGWDTMVLGTGERHSKRSSSRRYASYLDAKAPAEVEAFHAKLDAEVGFGSAPSSAKLHMAREHLGVDRVSSVWSYQGSRPAAFEDGIFGSMGDVVQRLDLQTKKPLWRCRMEFQDKKVLGGLLSPPALTASRVYITSACGDLVVLDRATGAEVWALNVESPIVSQPCVAGGKVFFGTADGFLHAFEADDPDPAGWPMWGGGPGHNGS